MHEWKLIFTLSLCLSVAFSLSLCLWVLKIKSLSLSLSLGIKNQISLSLSHAFSLSLSISHTHKPKKNHRTTQNYTHHIVTHMSWSSPSTPMPRKSVAGSSPWKPSSPHWEHTLDSSVSSGLYSCHSCAEEYNTVQHHGNHLLIYLFIYWRLTSPVNRTGSPQGFSQVQISHKLNTI